MNKLIGSKWVSRILGITLLVFTAALSQTTPDQTEEIDDTFRQHRVISGLKIKVDKNFTLSTFGAFYLGDGAQYKAAENTDPYAYNGWDLVPGFMMDFGEIWNKVKVSSGGDLYLLKRILQKGSEESFEYKPRWNLVLTRPISNLGTLTWTSRFERSMFISYVKKYTYDDPPRLDSNDYQIPIGSYFEVALNQARSIYRSQLKYNTPAFTNYKITPYISSESWTFDPVDRPYSESELGINISPLKGMVVTLSDILQITYRDGYIVKNHLLCLNLFYTLDLSGLEIFKN